MSLEISVEAVAQKWSEYVKLENGKISVDWEKLAKESRSVLIKREQKQREDELIGD